MNLPRALSAAAAGILAASAVANAAAPSAMDAARIARRAALVAQLAAEGAAAEARSEAARLRAEAPGAAEPALAAAGADPAPVPPAARDADTPRRGGVGGWLARRVVGFYRLFVGPALGERCALEPSCSHYFLDASRAHGLLGIPMTADRFVREPVVSAPDRPWVRTASGAWRHPDPVEDHDFWFSPPPAP